MSESDTRAPYIAGRHANRAPLLMKSSPALTLQLWDRSPAQDSQVFPLLLRTEHRPLTMGFGLSWVFLVAILRGSLWRMIDTEHVSGHD